MVDYWGAWLKEDHPNPALPGELRWYTAMGEPGHEQDVEVDGPGPVVIDGEPLLDQYGKPIYPKSRTFIPASLPDNPDLDESGYSSRLHTLSGDMRAMAEGDFTVGQQDQPYQVIPGEWVDLAMDRWHEGGGQGQMTVLACDIAQGGADNTTIARRYGGWFDKIISEPGTKTIDGPAVASLVLLHMRDACEVVLDMGGGYGQSAYDHLRQTIDPTMYDAREAVLGRDRTGKFTFGNLRAASWWNLREALDPNYGSQLALPRDGVLKQELCAVQKKDATGTVIKLEAKEDVIKRLGRSTDRADAVVMAWWASGKRRQLGGDRHNLPANAQTSRSGGRGGRFHRKR